MRKIVFSMALVALLSILVPAFAATTPALNRFELRSSEQPTGFYDILVLNGGQWQYAGILRYDKYFRSKHLDLRPFLPAKGTINIRLFQNGGGAAHIDAVQLGEQRPAKIEGTNDPMALKKILQKDFDVVDAYYKSLDLTFTSSGDNKILTMTARVEPRAISKVPFQFPTHNLFRTITAGSQFYPYQLKPKIDSQTDKTTATSDKAFFKEYCLTGSGHPSGFTYGWVSNDDKNLYVKIDFTPDNTQDGTKDYAKLYVRKGGQLNDFTVSEADTTWGNPAFTYTDKASYQHKVYNFSIPLETIGIEKPTTVEKIDLAFAAYGTATPGYLTTDTAFDEEYQRYLIVYVKYDGHDNAGWITGQMVDTDGSLFGTEFPISEYPDCNYPSIVHNPTRANFLVTFEGGPTMYGIFGQIVVPNGTLQGSNFPISDGADPIPVNAKGAHDDVYDQYLVIWEDQRNGVDKDIYGQVLDGGSGSPLGDNFPVMVATGSQYEPAIAFDSYAEKYLTAWTDARNGDYWDIYGRVIDFDGTLNGLDFAISSDLGSRQRDPAIAYDNANQLFSVVWEHGDPDPDNIYGKFIIIRSATYSNSFYTNLRGPQPCILDGTFGCVVKALEGDFVISAAINYQQNPYIIKDNQRFLTVWDDKRNISTTGEDIYGRYIGVSNPDLYPLLGTVSSPFVASTDDESYPSLAFNPSSNETLLAYRNWTLPTDTYDYIIFGANPNGSISGVISEAGTPTNFILNAEVILRDASGQQWSFTTQADGYYEFAGLQPGCYRLQVFPPTVSSYQISLMHRFNLAEGEDRTDFDIALEPNAYTITGTIRSGGFGLEGVNVHYGSEEYQSVDQNATTNSSGVYTLTNLPPGMAEISVRADFTNLAFTGEYVDLTSSISGVDFDLVSESIISGRVVDDNNDGIANMEVGYDGAFAGQHTFTDPDGYFTLGNLPAGFGEFEVEPDIGSGFCIPVDRIVYLGEGTRSEIGTVKLEPCALVQGTVITPNPDEICGLEVQAPGSNFEADPDVVGGSYQMLLPEGTHLIYLDTEGDGPHGLAAYPVQVTVNPGDIGSGTPVDVPDDLNIISFLYSNYGTINGNVSPRTNFPGWH
jgi:hypothetical protein